MVIDELNPSLTIGLTTVVKVPGHVSPESGVDDLPSVQIPSVQAEHVTTELELGLPDIRKRLAYDLPDVLDHGRLSRLGVFREEPQLVDR